MGVLKRIGRSSAVLWLGSFVAANYLRFVYWTSRWERINYETPSRFIDGKLPFIAPFWHGRLLMMPFAWPRGDRLYILISRHRDGALISNTMTRFGMKSIRGSTEREAGGNDKGARAALTEMLRKLRDGNCIGFTPDGPRGPRMRASEGLAALARLSGAPIVPCACAMRRRRILSSWDRMVVPLPFTRGVLMWGEPITVPHDAKGPALEAARLAIETAITELTREADRRCGLDPDLILPADPVAT
jgi:lysophospholipid acyltransferase (LPLAT)-like uncharacterized protein